MFLARSLPCAVLASCTLLSGYAQASAPAPRQITLTQPSGATIEVQLKGNAFHNWYENAQGQAIVKNGDSWVYARELLGALQPSDVAATEKAPAFAVSHYRPVATHLVQEQSSEAAFSDAATTQSALAQAASLTGKHPVLTIVVSFNDVQSQFDVTDTLWGSGKSLANYYLEQSQQQLTLVPATESEGANDGVVHVSLNRNHPACGNDCDYGIDGTLAAALAAADPYVDFASFDSDGDGTLSPSELAVQFVYAGEEASYGASGPAIWAHRWVMPTQSLDGVNLRDYLAVGEVQGDHGATMGIFAHELGHLLLGLPDLYVDGAPSGIGRWGLMGTGNWNKASTDTYLGQTPADLTAWSKTTAGLSDAEVQNADGNIQLADNQVQTLYIDPYLRGQQLGEVLYLEYRGGGYDAGLPGTGLLIEQADPRVSDNTDVSRPVLAIVQADGRGDLDAGSNQGDSGDLFPGYAKVRQYSPVTRDGQQSPVQISAISDPALPMSYSLAISQDDRSALLQHHYRQSPVAVAGNLYWGFDKTSSTLDGVDFYLPASGTVSLALYSWTGGNKPGSLISELGSFDGNAGWHRWMLESSQTLTGPAMLVVTSNAGFATETGSSASNQYRPNGQSLTSAALVTLLLSQSTSQGEPQTFSTSEDQPLTISLSALGLAGQTLSLSSNSSGTLTQNGDTLIYTPAANFNGEATFNLSVVGITSTASHSLVIDVAAVNDAPTLTLSGSTSLSGAATLSLTAIGKDVDGDTLRYSWQQTSGTSLSFDGSSATLSAALPASSTTQRYVFAVTVTDPSGASASQSVTVTQSPVTSTVTPSTSDTGGGGGGGGSLGWLSLAALLLLRRQRS